MIDLYDCPVSELYFDNIEPFETKAILKKLASAHKALAELKGFVVSIPNQAILINTLSLQEAKHSSEIENIITTQDDLFKGDLSSTDFLNPATKEVQSYTEALKYGFDETKKNGFIRLSTLLGVQELLEKNRAGLRALPGTELKNNLTGDTVYIPPQDKDDIQRLINDLIDFINNENRMPEIDPLVKMAIIHHQFESIHPFYDGNGRTGRILNILYLVNQKLLDIPILYLSRYIIQNKSDYYEYLQKVRKTDDWEKWILYMLDAVIETSQSTLSLAKQIKLLMQDFKNEFRNKLPKIYRQELLHNLFIHPYTKIEFVEQSLNVSWQTARRYLDELADIGLLQKEKMGKYNYYINEALFKLFLTY